LLLLVAKRRLSESHDLLVAEGFKRIDPRGAASGHPASKKGNSSKETDHDRERKGIGWFDTDDEAAKHARPCQRQDQTDGETYTHYDKPLTQNHLEDVV